MLDELSFYGHRIPIRLLFLVECFLVNIYIDYFFVLEIIYLLMWVKIISQFIFVIVFLTYIILQEIL